MKKFLEFDIDLPGYDLRELRQTDIAAVQRLFEKCADYVQIVDGEEVSPAMAEEIFVSRPPGRSLKDKFLFGLFDQQGELAGLLEGMRNYPDAGTWWIGLLMLAPEARGQGTGRSLVDAFSTYVSRHDGAAIMLGVVEDNQPAYEFWQRIGFRQQSKTEPRQFGKKSQAVYIMRRPVPGA